jgi:hypothetical protein
MYNPEQDPARKGEFDLVRHRVNVLDGSLVRLYSGLGQVKKNEVKIDVPMPFDTPAPALETPAPTDWLTQIRQEIDREAA